MGSLSQGLRQVGADFLQTGRIQKVQTLAVMIVVVLFMVSIFEFKGETIPHVYTTNVPRDDTREGMKHVCDCVSAILDPVFHEKTQRSTRSGNADVNRCYRPWELLTMQVMVLSEAFFDMVQQSGSPGKYGNPLAPSVQTFEGFTRTTFSDTLVSEGSKYFMEDVLSRLYDSTDGYYARKEIDVQIKFEFDEDFPTLPTHYVTLSLHFCCADCRQCALERTSRIFQAVLNRISRPQLFGGCFYTEHGNNCAINNSYVGRCILYRSSPIILDYAIAEFYSRLLSHENITSYHLQPGVTINQNLVIASFTHVEKRSARLYFVPAAINSPDLNAFLKRFASLDLERSCHSLDAVRMCDSARFCNIFMSPQSGKLEKKCLLQADRVLCRALADPEDVPTLGDFDLSSSLHMPVSSTNWTLSMCLAAGPCETTSPLLVKDVLLSSDRNHDTLLQVLGEISTTGQEYGCRLIFRNVIQYEGSLFESDCAESSSRSGEYCWLTGRSKTIKSLDAEWKIFDDPSFFDVPDRFVCTGDAKKKWYTRAADYAPYLSGTIIFIIGMSKIATYLTDKRKRT